MSDKYVILSESYKHILEEIIQRKDQEKVTTIPNSIKGEATARSSTLYQKEKIILYVGRLEYGQKRVDRLLKIWQRIQHDNKDWRLILVGDGPNRQELEHFVSKNRVNRVEFIGHSFSVVEYYKKSSVICLTSSIEGLPMILLESMNHGVVPIVYNSFSAATDVITHEHDGLLVRPFESTEYKNGLQKLLQDQPFRERLAENATLSARRFHSASVFPKWKTLISEINNEIEQ